MADRGKENFGSDEASDYAKPPDLSSVVKECYWKEGIGGSFPPEPSDPGCLPWVEIDGKMVPEDSPTAVNKKMLDLGLEFDLSDTPSQQVLKDVMADINVRDAAHDSSAQEKLASYLQKNGPEAFARLVDHLQATASDDYNILNNVTVKKDISGHVTEVKVNHLDNDYNRVILFKDQ
jgi:hypothetical protein